MKGGPKRGHEEGGADAFPGNIGYDNAHPAGVDGDEIIIVASHLITGGIRPGDLKFLAAGVLFGEEVFLDLGRQGQLLFHPLFFYDLLDKPDIFDLDGGQVRKKREQFQVVLGELVEERNAVGIHKADDLLVVPKRHAHGGMDVRPEDALPGLEARVVQGVPDQNRGMLLEGGVDDALAHLDLLVGQITLQMPIVGKIKDCRSVPATPKPPSAQVAAFNRNGWSPSVGISGRLASESAQSEESQ